jgi:ABC-type nitrate/sulfonate/bicarbonate transport system substrate-binding protein
VISQPQFKSLADLKGQKIAGASLASITTTIFKDVMQRQGIPPTAYTLLFVGGSPERFQAVSSGQVAASLAEAPPFNFRSIDAGRKVLLNYADEIKNLQYTSYFASNKSLTQNRPLLMRFMRAMGQAMRWLNDLTNENKSFRGEGAIDGPGLAEMIRLLASDQLISKREPWESFVDPSFLTPAK